jgi:DNA-binding MarR family transcriptional regulator
MPAAPDDPDGRLQIETSIAHLLHRAQQLAADLYVLPNPSDLTLRQAAVLSVVAERQGVSQAEIVRLSGVDRSTLAEMMQRLERQGLVERSRNPDDTRANAVTLTPLGRMAEAAARARCSEVDRQLLDRLPARDRARLRDLIERLVSPPPRAKTRL